MPDINGVRDSLDMEDTRDSLDSAVNDLLETTEKVMNATSKRQIRKYQKLREQQQKTVEDLMDDFESVFEVTSDGLDDLDRDMYDTFLLNRKKDLKLYDTAYKKSMKQQTKQMKGFFDDMDDQFDELSDDLSKIANVATALNVDKIKDSLEGSTEDTVDQLREIKKALTLSDDEMKDMKKTIQKSSSELSSQYGGMISSTDLTSAINYAVSELGVRDKERATEYGEQLSVFKAATDQDYESIDELVKTIDSFGWDSNLISQTANDMRKLSSSFEVSDEALASAIEQMNGRNEMLSNGNQEIYKELEDNLMKATTLLENSWVDSSKVFDKFNQDIGSFSEDMSWLAAGGADIGKMYNDFNSGDYTSAITEFYKGIQGLEDSGLYDSNEQIRKMVQDSLDITSTEWERIIQDMGQTSVDTMEDNVQNIMDSSEDMLSKSINESSYKKWYQKLLDKFGLSKVGGAITNFVEGLDMDLADLFVIGSGAKSIFKFLKGRGSGGFLSGLGEKIKGTWGSFFNRSASSATYTADDLASAFGTSIDDIISTFGRQASYSADDVARGMGSSVDDVLRTMGNGAGSVADGADDALRAASGSLDDVANIAGKLSKAGKVLGVVGTGVQLATGAYDYFTADNAKEKGEAVGGTGGSLLGGAGGAKIGAAIGTAIAPGLGTAIGGGLGALVGALGGDKLGDAIGGSIAQQFDDAKTNYGTWAAGLPLIGGLWRRKGTLTEQKIEKEKAAKLESQGFSPSDYGLPKILDDYIDSSTGKINWSGLESVLGSDNEYYRKQMENKYGMTYDELEKWKSSDEYQNYENAQSGLIESNEELKASLDALQVVIAKDYGDYKDLYDSSLDKDGDGQYVVWMGSKEDLQKYLKDMVSYQSSDYQEKTKIAGQTIDNPYSASDLDKDVYKAIKGNIDGSHKNGLDYVPYDGYLAELHQGEAVLTREENASVTSGIQNSVMNGMSRRFTPREKDNFRDLVEYAMDENDNTFAEIAVNFANRFVEQALTMLRRNKGMLGTLFGGNGYTISSGSGGSGGSFSSDGLDYGGFGGGTSSADAGATSQSASANETAIYKYLTGTMGLNKAGAAGVLGNIVNESSFDPNALGDGGTSYGICQWHNSRWEDLKKYCNSHNLDWKTLDGQLEFLNYELKTKYGGVYSTLKSVANTEQGAYDAAYKWCTDFEVPQNRFQEGVNRGNKAKTYFKNYSSYDVGTPWIPEDQIALVHKGEMIVPKKYNPMNSSSGTSKVSGGETLDMSVYKSLDVIADILRQGFAYLGKKIDGISINVNSTSESAPSEATSPMFFSGVGGIV